MKETCGICGQWKGLHEANTLHCPVDGSESGLFTEATYQDSEGMEVTIAAQAARIAELENALKKISSTLENNISLAANIEIQEINDGEYEISDVLEALMGAEKCADEICDEIAALIDGE